jgi:hypothetical protein
VGDRLEIGEDAAGAAPLDKRRGAKKRKAVGAVSTDMQLALTSNNNNSNNDSVGLSMPPRIVRTPEDDLLAMLQSLEHEASLVLNVPDTT